MKIEVIPRNVAGIFYYGRRVCFDIKSNILTGEIFIEIVDWSNGNKINLTRIFNKSFTLNLGKLKRGYYTLTIREKRDNKLYLLKKINFGVIINPRKRNIFRKSPFCLDVGASWFCKTKEDLKKYVYLIKNLGIYQVRDRFSWREIEKKKNILNYGFYEKSINYQIKHRLLLSQTFHDSPKWASHSEEEYCPPKDAKDLSNFLGKISSHFSKIDFWELWNEPDCTDPHFFLGEPREYVKLLKSSYNEIKRKNPQSKVLLCSLSKSPGNFAEEIFKGDIKDYFDIYNFHFYTKTNPKDVISRIKEHKQFLDKKKINKPLWITEIGFKRKKSQLSNEDYMLEASNLIKLYIYSVSEGIEKVFWFIFSNWKDKKYDFGLMKENFTPKPSYIALSNLTYQLGKGKFLSKNYFLNKNIESFVFETGNGRFVVAWTVGQKESLLINQKIGKIYDLFGRKINTLNERILINDTPLFFELTDSSQKNL